MIANNNVLIVAKCNVNFLILQLHSHDRIVLIVAKCNVNVGTAVGAAIGGAY